MTASIKNFLIGIFVVTALGIIVFMLLFLHPSVGDNAKTLIVRFTDIDKVNVGTRVTFAGHPVGEVVVIREIPSARTSRATEHGDIYVYELVLKVDSSVDVFNTDEIVLRTSGLLGERNIEINPIPLKKNQQLQKVDGEVLYAGQPPSVEDTMKDLSNLAKKFGDVLDDIRQVIADAQQQQIITKIGDSAQHLLEITKAIDQPEKLRQTIDNVFSLSEKVHRSWETVDLSLQDCRALLNRAKLSWTTVDQTLQTFHAAATDAASFTAQANALIHYTRQGKGTLGQLFVGDDLYLRLKSVLHKGEVVMNDVSTYGILFHTNKRWQRLQARRLRLLERLSTPYEFSRFFNREMEEISSSLSRVSMLLNESGCYPTGLLNNTAFAQRFADLLRHVENMEESLKMYNEQVVDQEWQEMR